MRIFYTGGQCAILLLLTVLACTQAVKHEKKTTKELFTEYFKPADDVSGMRGTLDETMSAAEQLRAQGMVSYGQKQYAQAIAAFNEYLKTNPNNLQVPFYLAVSHLALNNVDEADQQFRNLLNSPSSLYYEHSQWYTALIELNKNNLKESKILLEQILSNKNHYYYDMASDLIGQVDYMIEHGQ